MNNDTLSIIPLGGIGDVTRNLYIYEYKNQMLIVDCGLGFADETMLGVDLLLPDISYITSNKKNIVGMVFSHGHEDHIGALPFLMSQLLYKNKFPLYATPLTASFANEKLKEFSMGSVQVQTIPFDNPKISLGPFSVEFIRVTHSIPDTSHIFIQTPVGNFYHGSDFKFEETPWDKHPTDFNSIERAGSKGVLCLLSDCLGSERSHPLPSEQIIFNNLKEQIGLSEGKCIITTYSSHISRLNQIIQAAVENNRKVCFVGRSLLKAVDVGRKLGYLKLEAHNEVTLESIKNYTDKQLVLVVAGSQGQENSAMSRIVDGVHREIKLSYNDTVIFSSDPIPGNEVLVNAVVDSIAKKGIKVVYSGLYEGFHVSGHGGADDLSRLIDLVKPKTVLPIGGNFRHMAAYKHIAKQKGYKDSDILLLEDGQEVVFSSQGAKLGRKIPVKSVYVDEISGEKLESFVLRDRQKLSESGIVVVMAEIEAQTGQLADNPDVIARGFTADGKKLSGVIGKQLRDGLKNRKGMVTNWPYMRKLVTEISQRVLFKQLRRQPLIIPVVIEV